MYYFKIQNTRAEWALGSRRTTETSKYTSMKMGLKRWKCTPLDIPCDNLNLSSDTDDRLDTLTHKY